MSTDSPSPNGSQGRGPGGRFAKGNAGGPGNPNAKRVARLRTALLKGVTPEDMQQVVAAMLAKAKGGDVPAARELFQRVLGPAEAVDMMERLDALEATLRESAERKGQQPWQGN